MCHRTKQNGSYGFGRGTGTDADVSRHGDYGSYGDGDVPEADTAPYYKDVEPLPESSRPRRDGPGGE